MRNKVTDFTKAGFTPRTITLPKKQAVEVRCAEVSSDHPQGTLAQIIIQHLELRISATCRVLPAQLRYAQSAGRATQLPERANRRIQSL
jgi:hypothetical protein